MILNVSGRTDIVAFYTDWYMNRYKEGFVDVRNPFNPNLISRINFENVDLILFCTKNPIPILKYIDQINKPVIFHITLTPYKNDIEPNVPPKGKIVDAIKELSNKLGKDNVVIRYDPVFISDRYNLNYHIKAFDNLCKLLDGYISKIIISFIDESKNVKKNKKILNYKEFSLDDYKTIGKSFSKSASNHGIKVHTCFEDVNLVEYGFIKNDCLSRELAFKLTGKIFKEKWKARKGNKCDCVSMVDIGVYNSCSHMCKYCYANFDEDSVVKNMKSHNKNSSLLIGHLTSSDIIKERLK